MIDPLDVSHEIKLALNRNEPVVAIESSVIAHGLPPKVNVETALQMEDAVRQAGATPATVGVIGGKLRVGLTRDEIGLLGNGKAAKIAARDIPYAVSRELDGGTTVSATMRIAAAAGIGVIATGGIGGVHRGFGESLDVSADLWELAHTPGVVVCSGVKAVADVQATAEWLETHGVPVYGYRTDEFPAFYSHSSGIPVQRVDSAQDFAGVLKIAVGALGIRCAVLACVPIPNDSEFDAASAIDQAVREADDQGVKGKALTPFLLKRVSELTSGESMRANIALLLNNAKAAGEIACALTQEARRRVGFTA
ncbi:MAG: pseudouridine-5'-phosphate glycosidase [Armatimonadota bacterium]